MRPFNRLDSKHAPQNFAGIRIRRARRLAMRLESVKIGASAGIPSVSRARSGVVSVSLRSREPSQAAMIIEPLPSESSDAMTFDSPRPGRPLRRGISRAAALSVVAGALLSNLDAARASDTNEDSRVAKLGIDARFHSSVDQIAGSIDGSDVFAWQLPRIEVATLEIGDSFEFTLPDGRTVALQLVEKNWIGLGALGLSFSAPKMGGSAEVVLHRGLVAGGLRFLGADGLEEWTLASEIGADGGAIDRFTRTPETPVLRSSFAPPPGLLEQASEGGVAGDGCDDSGATIDVLIAYTPPFAAGFASKELLQALVLADVQRMNLAQTNSLSAPKFRAVDIIAAEDNGTGDRVTDLIQLALPADGWSDAIHQARNARRADLVVLYTDSEPGVAAFLSVVNGVGNQAAGFSVVGSIGGFELSRALAFNLGSCDAPGDTTPACEGAFSFSNAHRFAAGGAVYRTLMAREPGIEIPHFSNPNVEYLGQDTGLATANNARSMSLVSATVASYRCSFGAAPDCDGDGILDSDAIALGIVPDCNLTGIPDSCDIALGISIDANLDGIPDECPLTDAQLIPPGLAILDTVGSAVSASSKSADPVVLYGFGAPGNDVGANNAGAAWVLPVTAGVPDPLLARVLRPSDPVANAFFGRGLSVFKRPSNLSPAYPARNMACVGAFRWNQSATNGNFPSKGAIYLFDEQIDGSWSQVRHGAALTPWRYTPPTTGGNAAGPYSLFGYSVALGRNPIEQSETIIVGAPGRSNGRGAVYVVRNPASNVPALHTIRTLGSAQDGDGFGTSVALAPRIPTSGNARVAFVAGAPGRNDGTGAAFIYERPAAPSSFGTWAAPVNLVPTGFGLQNGDRFGTAVAISEKLVVVGAPGDDGGKGRVYFWERGNGTGSTNAWRFRGSFAPADGAEGDEFGASVAVARAAEPGVFTVTVGAPGREVNVGTTPRTDAGAAYILKKSTSASGAGLLSVRAAFAPASGDEFGYSAAAVPGFSILGAPFNDAAGLNAGMIRITINP